MISITSFFMLVICFFSIFTFINFNRGLLIISTYLRNQLFVSFISSIAFLFSI